MSLSATLDAGAAGCLVAGQTQAITGIGMEFMKLIAKRSDNDRRKVDQGPPAGWKQDRRRKPDRRALETIEVVEATFEEFVALRLEEQRRTGTR